MITEEKLPKMTEGVSGFLKKNCLSLLKAGKPVYVIASGMSMYPFLKGADRLKVAPVKKDELKIGDIIAADGHCPGAWFIVHRIVKVSEDKKYYYTKGDFHKEGTDEPVTAANVVGKVVRLRRKYFEINLEKRIWKRINRMIAKLSLSYPRALVFLAPYISLAIEWKLLPAKVKNWLKKGNPLDYNTEELILICARKDLSDGLIKDAVGLIREGVCWERFCESAMRHGVTALVYRSLMMISGRYPVPDHVTGRLKNAHLLITAKTDCRHGELTDILRFFHGNNVPVVPLKGTCLARRLYGDGAKRGLSADIDLLVKMEDTERATALLKNKGYSLDVDKKIEGWRWQYSFYNFYKSRAAPIDLHWDVAMSWRSQKRMDGFWDGMKSAASDNTRYYEFKEEELLLYLCAHLANGDAFNRLIYVCDINEFLGKYGGLVDWGRITKKARDWKLLFPLYMGLMLSRKLLGSRMPDTILDKIKPSLTKRAILSLLADKKLILRDSAKKRIVVFLGYAFFELMEAANLAEYRHVMKEILFPPQEAVSGAKDEAPSSPFLRHAVRIFRNAGRLLRKCTLKDA